MTNAFVRRGDAVRMQMRMEEVDLLRRMRDELHAALSGGLGADDPLAVRLFPPAVVDDDPADAELRGMIHGDLLASRLRSLEDLLDLLERATRHRGRLVVDLVEEEPVLVLGVLNDIRLALGARAGLDVVEDRDLALTEQTHATLAVMDWFAMWQEQLLAVLDPESAQHYEESGFGPPLED